MINYYSLLKLDSSATNEQIRKAFRKLAKKYHPDINEGTESAEHFKLLSEAHEILSSNKKRNNYDKQFSKYLDDQKKRKFSYEFDVVSNTPKVNIKTKEPDLASKIKNTSTEFIEVSKSGLHEFKSDIYKLANLTQSSLKKLPLHFFKNNTKEKVQTSSPKIIAVSLSYSEAISGCSKEILLQGLNKRIRIKVPQGTWNGMIIPQSANTSYILQADILPNKYISVEKRGLILLMPITLKESVNGGKIMTNTPHGKISVKVPANCQSGAELCIKNKGYQTENSYSDLYVKFLIEVPDCIHAVGYEKAILELENYYEKKPRAKLRLFSK